MNDERVWASPVPPPTEADRLEAAWWRGWRGAIVVGGGALLLVLLVGLALGDVEIEDRAGTDVDVVTSEG